MTREEKRQANNLASIRRNKKPERMAYMKAYYAAMNPEQHASKRAYKAEYDAAHKEESAAYRVKNAERLKAQKRAYYLANRERTLARVKAYTESNYERVLAYHAAHYLNNTDRIKSNVAAYRKANPERKQYHENARRVRKLNNGGSHTFEELKAKFDALGNVCFYCGSGGQMCIDHDIPISRGGGDGIENILPACGSCNSSKNAKTAKEFIEWRAKLKAIEA